MGELKNRLDKKIGASNLFIVVATKNYIEAIRCIDINIITQINIARELKKPFFIIIDNKLSKVEKEFIRKYFSKDNIIERMDVDIRSRKGTRDIAREIKKLTWEITGNNDVRIITQDDDGSYDADERDKDK